MSIDELMHVEIAGSGTLTKTTRKKVPAAVTTLTRQDIQRTGARSLDELLLILVPNVQKQFHRNEYEHMGVRGIMSDRDDKYLLLVNGRLMNDRFFYGAMAERDLPMLGDIHHVDIIRGPGSALYGPGAIGMVINIITESGQTFQGVEATARLGSLEEFYSGEIKIGHRFTDDRDVFLYAGMSEYPGADGDLASRVYSIGNRTATDETGYGNQSVDSRTRAKLYAEYNQGGLEAWIRYTQGGHYRYNPTPLTPSDGDAYLKLTGYVGFRQPLSDTFAVTPSFSYDMHQDFDSYLKVRSNSWRRDEYDTKLMFDWTPNDKHQVTFGGEWSHAVNNLSGRWSPLPDWGLALGDPFYTDLQSILGEYQWRLADAVTLFVGGRLDWHNYLSDELFSPRAALVWSPTEKDIVKLMYTRSSRANNDSTMRQGYLNHRADPTQEDLADIETIDAYELRYERQHSNALWLAGSLFYHFHEPMAWGGRLPPALLDNGSQKPLGPMQSIGAELETVYRVDDRMRVIFSHSYTKLLKYKQEDTVEWQPFTGGPGYNDDYAHWDDNVTKLHAEYDLTPSVSMDGSLGVLWGSPGKSDFVKWRRTLAPPNTDKDIYDGGVFLSLGVQYQASENLLVRFDAYNILGFIDKDINAVKSLSDRWATEEYNTVAPAFGVSLSYTF
ncbi:MAG: TonB-dependent receptor plug domain-containing protein [Sedimentisphaerales bacterium]|nr:TonB-dependent receptor plug domain-containing protein [Sedimentisphaerales bacterium]